MTTRNKKLNRAAQLGKRIEGWRTVAIMADRICELAVGKLNDYTAEQRNLLRELNKEESLTPQIARFQRN